jgi:LysM repeat protein
MQNTQSNATTSSAQTVSTSETAPTPTSQTVTVQNGDYLSKIAEQYGTTMLRLFYANTQISDPNLIFPGQQLRVPTADEQLTPRDLPGDAPAEMTSAVQSPPVTPVAQPDATPQATTAPAPTVASGSVWDSLAACESGGNWSINTGNGFYGGLQFTLSSWRAMGGSGYPNQASRAEQIARAERLLAAQGWGAWPACSAKLGL